VISPKLMIVVCCIFGQLAFAGSPQVPAVPVPTSSTKSFSEWKKDKIQAATDQLTKARAPGKDVSQLEFNLDVAESLSVTDYLVLYISPQAGTSKYLEAASRLSPGETAKIMEAYLKAMQSQRDAEKQTEIRSSATDLFN